MIVRPYLIIGIFLLAFFSFASAAPANNNFDEIYFTSGPGNLTQKDTFYYGIDQPWLFIRFFDTQDLDYIVGSRTDSTMKWDTPTAGDTNLLQFWPVDPADAANTNGIWMSFPSEAEWRGKEELGYWSVDLTTQITKPGFPPTKTYSGSAGFTVSVIPEPVSIALFVLGGGALAVARKFRKG